jgi:hypothetical protein
MHIAGTQFLIHPRLWQPVVSQLDSLEGLQGHGAAQNLTF